MTAQPVVLGPGQGWQFWTSVIHGTVKAESGKGHFSIYESSPPPGGPGPAPHIHRSYVEEWLVTEGTGQFVLGYARYRVDAGSFAFVPHGVAHAFSDPGPGRARILVIGEWP